MANDFSTLRITKPTPSGPLLEALGAQVYSDDIGVANAYAITVSPSPTLVAGTVVTFKAAHGNSGASTITINGGLPITIKKFSNGSLVDLASGDIAAGQIIITAYDAVNGVLQATTGAAGSATHDEVLTTGALLNMVVEPSASPLVYGTVPVGDIVYSGVPPNVEVVMVQIPN